MHIYCINLERRPDRRARAESQFERAGLAVEFFSGTDGREHAPSGLYVTPSEYGCADSHVRVWRDIVAKGHEIALILEDDVELSPNFGSKLEEVLAEATEWDMIFLGYILPIVHRDVSENLFEGQPLGTHAYLINIDCARRLSNFDPKLMKVGIDTQLNRFPLKILCSKTILASQGDAMSSLGLPSFKSMIEGDIGIMRTMDFNFFIRFIMQKCKPMLIYLITCYFVENLTKE
jgi:Glycosyltransferase family 25 (LPS biosynthesis protein)